MLGVVARAMITACGYCAVEQLQLLQRAAPSVGVLRPRRRAAPPSSWRIV